MTPANMADSRGARGDQPEILGTGILYRRGQNKIALDRRQILRLRFFTGHALGVGE